MHDKIERHANTLTHTHANTGIRERKRVKWNYKYNLKRRDHDANVSRAATATASAFVDFVCYTRHTCTHTLACIRKYKWVYEWPRADTSVASVSLTSLITRRIGATDMIMILFCVVFVLIVVVVHLLALLLLLLLPFFFFCSHAYGLWFAVLCFQFVDGGGRGWR